MTSVQLGFTIFFITIGAFEIISNSFHLFKGSIDKIGLSAKRQHGELPDDLTLIHYFIKVILMLAIGVIFTTIGLIMIFSYSYLALFASLALILMGIYGFLQGLIYRGPLKVWISAIVYNIPLIIHILLIS